MRENSRNTLRILLTAALVSTAALSPARAQFFDESSAAGYWMRERMREERFMLERTRPLRQTPTRLISRAPPMRAIVKPTDQPPPSASETEAADAQDKRARIAVLGDDLATNLFAGLNGLASEREAIRALRRTKDNSGLVRSDFYDWQKGAREVLDGKERVDLAVVLVGVNDRQPLRDGKGSEELRSPRWKEIYTDRARTIGAAFRDKKIPLVWVGLPIMGNDRLSADFAEMNEIFKQAARDTGAVYVDVWEAFADERGHFSSYGPDINGQMVRLRTSDGVHFTDAGSRKLAHFVDGEISRILGDKARPATASLTPAAPVQPEKPQPRRPDVGPVLQLNAPPLSPGGVLMKADKPVTAPDLEAVLARGIAPAPKPGRADDFSWTPRP